jgi:hypothetical protein
LIDHDARPFLRQLGAEMRHVGQGVTLGMLCLAEAALPVSSLRLLAGNVGRKRLLARIQVADVRVGVMTSHAGRRPVSVAYALVFPKTGHYLTFPANIGRPQNRVFGDYDTTQLIAGHDVGSGAQLRSIHLAAFVHMTAPRSRRGGLQEPSG